MEKTLKQISVQIEKLDDIQVTEKYQEMLIKIKKMEELLELELTKADYQLLLEGFYEDIRYIIEEEKLTNIKNIIDKALEDFPINIMEFSNGIKTYDIEAAIKKKGTILKPTNKVGKTISLIAKIILALSIISGLVLSIMTKNILILLTSVLVALPLFLTLIMSAEVIQILHDIRYRLYKTSILKK